MRRRRPCRPGALDDHWRWAHQGGRYLGHCGGSSPLHPAQAGNTLRWSRSVDRPIGRSAPPGRISKAGSPLLRTLLVEAAHALARWDTGPLGQFYARKAQEVGSRKAIIALARKLLIMAWRMLLTGEVYRAAKATAVARKQRELRKKLQIHTQTSDAVQASHARDSTTCRRRQRNREHHESTANSSFGLTSSTGGNPDFRSRRKSSSRSSGRGSARQTPASSRKAGGRQPVRAARYLPHRAARPPAPRRS